MNKPAALIGCLLLMVAGIDLTHAADPRADAQHATHVYKTVGSLEILADVWSLQQSAPTRPVVIWIHGGALINGHRESVPPWMRELFLPRSYAIVSIDYRLAPETKLPDIVADVVDAVAWVADRGPQLFAADPRRIAVVGGSAGGYLTLLTGYRARPRPAALVSLWGYGDLGAAWTFEKSPHARHAQGRLSDEAARQLLAGPPVADSRRRQGDGGAFYQQARREGTWAQAVTGWDPRRQAEQFTPFMPERNVTRDFPPTLLIHGDADTDVPLASSVRMAEQLAAHGVEHRLIRFAGAEHGLPGVDREQVTAAYRAAADFIIRHFERPRP